MIIKYERGGITNNNAVFAVKIDSIANVAYSYFSFLLVKFKKKHTVYYFDILKFYPPLESLFKFIFPFF